MAVRPNVSTLLLMLFIGWALSYIANAARTHEKFAQSTYDEAEPEATIPPENLSEELKPIQEPEVVTSTDFSRTENPATDEREKVSIDETKQPTTFGYSQPRPVVFTEAPGQEQRQHYRDYRGVTYSGTPAQGDFVPDAKPWWVNAPIVSYSTTQDGSSEVIPNRYPLGYPTRFDYKPQLSDSANAGSQYSSRGIGGRYMWNNNIPQYNQGGRQQFSAAVPYEMTGGGCPAQYWIHNTQRWPAFFNVKTTVGEALGAAAKKVYGDTTMMEALQNNRQDGHSVLLRSGATAILNSYSRSQYKYSHVQVMEAFADALVSSDKAAVQAASFEEANVSDFADQYNSCT